MSRFQACLAPLLVHEGGYSDNPDDPGGATKYGITRATLTAYLGRPASKADVRALTPASVAPIYEHRYWQAIHGDELPAGVDYITFDGAVQHGPKQALKFLQRAAGVIADGIYGQQTRGAVQHKNPKDLIASIYAQRRAFYHELNTFPVFGRGWLRRLDEVFTLALEMA